MQHSAPELYSEIELLTYPGSWAVLQCEVGLRHSCFEEVDDWIQFHRKLSLEEGHSLLFAEQKPWGFCLVFFFFLRNA
jgi:hypothetical protein